MGDCSRVRELVAATILCLAFAPVSLAAVMVPTNLGPGGQYQHTFVTGTTTDATSTVVSDYNNFATGDVTPAGGELTALGLRWRALEFKVGPDVGANPDSQSSTVAGDGSMGVPVSLLNDRRLVDSAAPLPSASQSLPCPHRTKYTREYATTALALPPPRWGRKNT